MTVNIHIFFLGLTDVFKQKLNKVGIMLNKQNLCNYDMNEVIYYMFELSLISAILWQECLVVHETRSPGKVHCP